MNLQFWLASAAAGVVSLGAPAVTINSFDDLTAHIPEAHREVLTETPRLDPLAIFGEETPSSAAEMNFVLFRGVDMQNPYGTNLEIPRTLDDNVLDASELNCLAENIYHESRGEPLAGQMAVGLVTMNRVNSNDYPNSICDVVYQRFEQTCQFEWTCNAIPDRIREEEAWQRSVTIASRIMNERVSDFTDGATNFYSGSEPSWATRLVRTAQIGNHTFLRRV